MNFQKKLSLCLDRWVEKGIIKETQRNLIKKDLKQNNTSSIFFHILATIGALLVGIGIILIISANWEHFAKTIKLIFILLMPISALGGGYYLSYIKKQYKKIGNALIFLSSLLIGATLALLGQLYHLEGSELSLLTWWIILSLPLMLITKLPSIGALNIILFYLIILFFFEDHTKIQPLLITLVVSSIIIIAKTMVLHYFQDRNKIIAQYIPIINICQIVSINVLLGALFGGVENLPFLEISKLFTEIPHENTDRIFHHIIFLLAIFGIMWVTNKTYRITARNSTFMWLGLFIIFKYFDRFWGYMDIGISFLVSGVLLMGMVVGHIKYTQYLKRTKQQSTQKNKKIKTNKNNIKE